VAINTKFYTADKEEVAELRNLFKVKPKDKGIELLSFYKTVIFCNQSKIKLDLQQVNKLESFWLKHWEGKIELN
jgi:hypothetical protein